MEHTKTEHASQVLNYKTSTHKNEVPFLCENCGLALANISLLNEHMVMYHTLTDVWDCQLCPYKAKDKDILQSHHTEKHEEFVILHTMADQVNTLNDNVKDLDVFKADLGKAIKMILNKQNDILNNQNIIMQDLFLIKNSQKASQDAGSQRIIEKKDNTHTFQSSSLPPPPPPSSDPPPSVGLLLLKLFLEVQERR